jgi:hypothetical protein
MKFLHSLCALLELSFSTTPVATLFDGSFVLWPEMLAKLVGPAPLQIKRDNSTNDYDDDRNDNGHLCGSEILQIHTLGSSCL